MVFTITSFNKQVDIYTVESDLHEKQCVSANQIISVMLKGYSFTNAKLTKKGFAIVTDKGTRYIQVDGLPKQVYMAMSAKIDSEKAAEDNKKRAMTQAIQSTPKTPQTVGTRKRVVAKPKADAHSKSLDEGHKLDKLDYVEQIHYMGRTYFSDASLCKEFGRDLNKYRALRSKGYTISEALGKVPLRPESELSKPSDINKVLDNMAYQRGEY